MYLALTIPAALLPSLLLFGYFYRKDLNPEPQHVLRNTFVLGILTVVPVLLVGVPGILFLRGMSDPSLAALFMAFALAAIPEEFFKFLVVWGYCARHQEFDEPMDGMVYGAVASLGFATMENVLYVLEGGLSTAIARALTAVPSHAFLGAIMGYFVTRARFGPSRQRGYSLFWALCLPILLHGAYDYPLILVQMQAVGGNDLENVSGFVLVLLVVPFLVLILAWILTVRLVHRLRALQLRIKEREARGQSMA